MGEREKIYNVVYCRSKELRYPRFLITWHLVECPLIGIKSLSEARERARKLKAKSDEPVQAIIIGETLDSFRTLDADRLYGINALRGADAKENVPISRLKRRSLQSP